MGKSAPSAPDPVATANAQGAANEKAVKASYQYGRYNTNSPYGNTYWEGPLDNQTQVTQLTPEGQSIFDTQVGITSDLTNKASGLIGYLPQDQFSLSGAPDATVKDFSSIADSSFNSAKARLDPVFQEQRRALETQLAAKGISLDNPIAQDQLNRLERSQNDAYTQAAYNADLVAGNEQSRQYGLDLSQRQQYISDYTTERDRPFNEISAFLQGSPALGSPSAPGSPAYQVQPADVQGAANMAYQGQLNAYNTQQQLYGGLIGAGGTVLGGWLGG